MNTFYIVRHGETENNVAKRLSGWIDTPLTSNGLVPTESVVEKIKGITFDEVYSSDVGRAFITAYFITRNLGLEVEIKKLSGLREVNYGDAANMLSAKAYELYPKLDRDTSYTPPNGESLEHMQQRVIATIESLNNSFEDSTVLLVAHSGVMAALRASYLGVDFGEHNISEAYPHDYVGKFTWKDASVKTFDSFTS